MNLKTWIRLGGILTVLLVTTPILAVAQGYGRDRATERGPIQIDNNWRDLSISRYGQTVGKNSVAAGSLVRENPPSWLSGKERSRFGQTTRSRLATTGDGLTSVMLDGFRMECGTSMCAIYGGPHIVIGVMIVTGRLIREMRRTT